MKNNTDTFDEDFGFQLSEDEWKNLRSYFLTSSEGEKRYTPTAFAEQGIYILMTTSVAFHDDGTE